LLASCYGWCFAINEVKRLFSKMYLDDPTINRDEVIDYVCSMKSYCTRKSVLTTQICKDTCGGQSFISANRIVELNCVAGTLVIVEGDSNVLAQKVSLKLLDKFKKQGSGFYILLNSSLKVLLYSLRLTINTNIRDRKFHFTLLQARQYYLTRQLAFDLRHSIKSGFSSFDAWSKNHLDIVLHLHQAFAENFILEQYYETVDKCNNRDMKIVLNQLYNLYALSIIEEDLAWFLMNNLIGLTTAKEIVAEVKEICQQISAENAINLVKGFDFPDHLLSLPIANNDEWKKIFQ